MIGDSNDCNLVTYFGHKLLITDPQILRIYNAFINDSAAYEIFSKTQQAKMLESGNFLGRV